MWLYLAQSEELLQGDVQDVLAWVILALVALYGGTVAYFIKRQHSQEAKYDKLQIKVMKALVRSNRAIEAVADLPPPPVEEFLDDEDA